MPSPFDDTQSFSWIILVKSSNFRFLPASPGHPIDVELSLGLGSSAWGHRRDRKAERSSDSVQNTLRWHNQARSSHGRVLNQTYRYQKQKELRHWEIKKRKQEEVECVCFYPGCLRVRCHSSHCTHMLPLRCSVSQTLRDLMQLHFKQSPFCLCDHLTSRVQLISSQKPFKYLIVPLISLVSWPPPR